MFMILAGGLLAYRMEETPDIIEKAYIVESFEEKETKPLKTSAGKRVKIKGEWVKAHTGYHKRSLYFSLLVKM